LGNVPARVTLSTPDGATVASVGRGRDLTVTGDIAELTMFVAGRDEARLTFSDAQAIAAVRSARRGL
jgi:hypothetical protein